MPTVVTRGERQLRAAKKALDARGTRAGNGIHSWYVDPAGNTVVVRAAASAKATATAFVKASGADWTIIQPAWFAQGFSEDFLRYHVLAGGIDALYAGALKGKGFTVHVSPDLLAKTSSRLERWVRSVLTTFQP